MVKGEKLAKCLCSDKYAAFKSVWTAKLLDRKTHE